MQYNITRNNKIIATVNPAGNYDAKIMSSETVTMNFTQTKPVEFLIGDMVKVFGQLFILNVAPTVEKVSSIQYNYSLQFEAIKYELGKIQFLFPDANNNLVIPDFSIMGDAKKILNLIVQNANRIHNEWKLGKVDETETKNIFFSANNLLTALTTLADEFKNEFWIDKDKTIHFTTRKNFSGLTLEYGKNKGLRSLSRSIVDSSNIVTRLYAYGSTKNIAAAEGIWTNRLTMDTPYLEKNTVKFGVIEHTEIFEDIYPNRIGKVTAVNESNFLQFSDNTLDFDLNSSEILIPGTTAKVTFNTGQLAGYTFEIKQHGFNNHTKTFELQTNQEEKAIQLPNKLIRPAIGDKYVLTDIIMPRQYKDEAIKKLKNKASEYLNANCEPRLKYACISDPFYFEKQNVDISLGKTIKMVDHAFGLDADIRVVELTKDLQNPYNIQFELADQVQISRFVRNYLDDRKWENQIIEHQQNVDRNVKRGYLFSKEIRENIFDADGYFDADKIKPLSIETKMLSVGARSQQFSITNARLIIINNTTIKNEIGQLAHFTIEDKERIWNILESTITNIKDSFNYIYVKCQKNGNNANFVITTEKIKVDQDPTYFYFEYGFLSSVIDGFRRIRTSYGFTDINGGEITTGKILGQSGQTFIDIDNRKIYGSVEFLPDSPAFDQIKDSINIGGRNYLQYSKIIKGARSAYSGVFFDINTYLTTSTILKFDRYSEYIFYLKSKTDINYSIAIGLWYGSTYLGEANYLKFNEKNNGVFNSGYADGFTVNIFIPTEGKNNINLVDFLSDCEFKLEKGNVSTEWTTAPEDVQRIENITSFLGTTVDKNIVATGLLMVGSGNNVNAGISGLSDKSGNSFRFWAGANVNDRSIPRWSIDDNGFERCFHRNGRIASERGFDGDKWVFNMYNEQGWIVFQLDSKRGLVPPKYTDESYTFSIFIKTNQTNKDFNAVRHDIINLVSRRENVDYKYQYLGGTGDENSVPREYPTGKPMFYLNTYRTLISIQLYEYYNGTNPNNLQYEYLRGWKKGYNRYNNADDGWYVELNTTELFNGYAVEPLKKEVVKLSCVYMDRGKVITRQSIDVTLGK